MYPADGYAALALPGESSMRGWMATLRVDAWLQERAPAAGVADLLRCSWRGDLSCIRTPLPDECFDLFWVEDGSLWLSGPESSSWRPRGSPPGRHAVGVRCRPGVGPALFGIAASEVRDLRVRLDELWPGRDAGVLRDRLDGQPGDLARVRELERAAGYFDQQHLAHEARAITGTTARDLMARV